MLCTPPGIRTDTAIQLPAAHTEQLTPSQRNTAGQEQDREGRILPEDNFVIRSSDVQASP